MKRRILAAAVALVVGAVAWTRAQEPSGTTPPIPGPLRPNERIVQLRAELEILQLEYDANRAYLVDAIREHRAAEQLNAMGNPNLQMSVAAAALGSGNEEATKAINDGVAKGLSHTAAAKQHVIARERKRIEANRAYLARAKQEFARLGQALADKQAAYNEATKAPANDSSRVATGLAVKVTASHAR